MALLAAESALVAGSAGRKDMQIQNRTVRVLRAFFIHGKPTKVGDVLELPKLFALEMHAAKKVEFVEPKAEDKPKAEKPKGESHAR
jgi:hypothetical protein